MTSEDQLLDILRETVIPGGIILNALRGRLDNKPKESDLPTEMADSMSTAHTIGDDLVQEVALQILRSHSSDFRINAEEETPRINLFTGNQSSYCYHLDPLDGTFSYLNDKDGYAVGAAFSKGLRFEATAIYFPARDRVYLAQRGKGIRVENSLGEELEFKRHEPLKDMYIQRRAEQLVPVMDKMKLSFLKTMGAHHGMLSIAEGDAQVLMYRRASPHDFGIPQVIVEEAGGICTDLEGNPVKYDSTFERVPLFLAFSTQEARNEFFEVYSNLDIV